MPKGLIDLRAERNVFGLAPINVEKESVVLGHLLQPVRNFGFRARIAGLASEQFGILVGNAEDQIITNGGKEGRLKVTRFL
jgi:hypothetical protein